LWTRSAPSPRRRGAASWIPADINDEVVSQHLYTRHWPDPDVLIRTSGEMRVSNFLLWQISYAELVITPTLWPDSASRSFLRRWRNTRVGTGGLAGFELADVARSGTTSRHHKAREHAAGSRVCWPARMPAAIAWRHTSQRVSEGGLAD